MRQNRRCGAYRRIQPDGIQTLTVLNRVVTLRSLLRDTPDDAVPGWYYDEGDRFEPLPGRVVA